MNALVQFVAWNCGLKRKQIISTFKVFFITDKEFILSIIIIFTNIFFACKVNRGTELGGGKSNIVRHFESNGVLVFSVKAVPPPRIPQTCLGWKAWGSFCVWQTDLPVASIASLRRKHKITQKECVQKYQYSQYDGLQWVQIYVLNNRGVLVSRIQVNFDFSFSVNTT